MVSLLLLSLTFPLLTTFHLLDHMQFSLKPQHTNLNQLSESYA